MSEILFQYERVNPTSWAYLSSLLSLALFFKFNRVFSLRNLDLFLLILISPGLLLVQWSMENEGIESNANALNIQRLGFLWLFAVHALLLTRLLLDTAFVRRPLLDPNINAAGLAFLGSSLLFFMMANVVTGEPKRPEWSAALPAAELQADRESGDSFETEGPGYWLLYLLPRITTQKVVGRVEEDGPRTAQQEQAQQKEVAVITTRVMAVISHFMIVSGLVIVGARHFDNATIGLAMATIYLLLPYTAMRSGDPSHVLPGAHLTWAIVLYRRPMLAGMMIGLASGMIYYPIFLLPLWCSFYWERGLKRFLTGALLTMGGLVVSLALTAGSLDGFLQHVSRMFGVRLPQFEHLQGIWRDAPGFWNSVYRVPILAAFVLLAISFAAWPVRKHLGTIISCTAALLVGAQFWHAYAMGGGMYVAWYLPLSIMITFRPNLADRVAVATVAESWWHARQRARGGAAAA